VPELLVRGAVAPAVTNTPRSEPAGGEPVREAGAHQGSLFRDGSAAKVVPIPTLTPLRPAERHARRSPGRLTAPRPRRVPEAQQAFELHEYRGEVQSRPEEKIYCAAPVASPPHRALAGAVDGALVLAGAGIVVLPTVLAFGSEIAPTRVGLLVLVAVAAAVYALYRLLWALAGADTPGMGFAGLRLVDFDGRNPRLDRRLAREAARVLSIVSVGLGLVWALVDEESLAWHDHISKTFPTPQ
jgi:uncharacterized RDD family membrane protein YckC